MTYNTPTGYDIAMELINKNVPHIFTISEAKQFSELFKDHKVGNLLSKMSNAQKNKFPVTITKVGKTPKGIIWEWQPKA